MSTRNDLVKVKRVILCSRRFRSSKCGYSGTVLMCERTFKGCKKLKNEKNFCGVPYLTYDFSNGSTLSIAESGKQLGPKKGGKNMPATLRHEVMRFNEMTERKLWTRLGKIGNPQKLMNFSIIAEERGMVDLAIAAKARLKRIRGESIDLNMEKAVRVEVRKINETLTRKLDI